MTTDQITREEAFIERVEKLGSGELAMLRRNCGARDPVEGRCPWLVGLIHGAAKEPVAFLTASLLAQYKTLEINSGRHKAKGNFGVTWKRATADAKPDSSIRRRFHIILDADYDPWTGEGDLPYRLRQMVKYAANKGVGIDWPTLLKDLKYWNYPEKQVQKRWARSFFTTETAEDEAASDKQEEPQSC